MVQVFLVHSNIILCSNGHCCCAYVCRFIFGNNFSLSNLQPLASKELGWFNSIIMIVSIAPWAYVGFDNIPQTAEEFNFSPNKTFKLIVYSLLAAALTYVIMILYTGWLGTNNANFNGNLWLTGAETQTAFGYIGLGVLAIAIIMGILLD